MLIVLKCSFIIIGTIIGAGFASGQEIASFFNRFGSAGLFGNMIASFLFASATMFTLFTMKNKKISSYQELIQNNLITKYIVEFFLFACFCVMIAGVGAFFEEQFNIPFWYGAIIAASVCSLTFMYKLKGIETINSLLVPLMILGILMIGLGNYNPNSIEKIVPNLNNNFTNNWFVSCTLYASYNLLVLIPVITTFNKYKFSGKQIIGIATITFVILGLAGVLIFRVVDIFYPYIMNYQMPTLRIASMLGAGVNRFYSFVIIMAIFTSAVSSGYAFLNMRKKAYTMRAVGICVASVLFAKVGFANLVNIFFPIFGYLGIIQLVLLVITSLKNDNKGEIYVKE